MAAMSKVICGNQGEAVIPPKGECLSAFSRIWREFVKAPERRRLCLAVIALVVSSASNLAFPTIIGKGIDIATRPENAPRVRYMLAAAVGIFSVGAFASWLRVYSFKLTTHRVEQKMRKRLFHSLMLQESEFFTQQCLGDLNSRLLQDVQVSSRALTENIAQTLRGINSAFGGTAMLAFLSPRLTLVTLSLFPLLGAGMIFYRRKVKSLQHRLQDNQASAVGHAEERLTNLETVRLFGKEEHEVKEMSKKLDNLYNDAKRVAFADGIMMGTMSLAMNTSLLSVLVIGSSLLHNGSLSIGNLTSFALYSTMVGLGFASLSQVYGELVKASVSADRVFEILDRKVPTINEGETLAKISGEIEFDNVGFAYTARPETSIVKKLSFKILPGQIVAIAGASGAGKTTISRLLTRLVEPTSGDIRVDGCSISKLNPTWLRQDVFGIVNQEPVLFDMSIAENIAYARPNVSIAEIEQAAAQANADGFIKRLPEGYNTKVGERGARLSVGEKQRIAIARAILKNPPCLILDEATSSLDTESERLVQEALERLMQGRTTLMIAHRSTTLKYAHRIEVLKDGAIIEQGSYNDLLNRPKGIFYGLSQGMNTVNNTTS